jgi:hypothetical protein
MCFFNLFVPIPSDRIFQEVGSVIKVQEPRNYMPSQCWGSPVIHKKVLSCRYLRGAARTVYIAAASRQKADLGLVARRGAGLRDLRLGNGDLFLHSPIAFDSALADRLQTMGKVRHLVSPNQFHYAHIGEWSRAFPQAVTWASPRVRERAHSRGVDVHFDRDVGVEPPQEWRAEIDQTAVPGGIFGEIVFFHKSSKTLILADTIINLDPT